jgi:hypothetical protein
VIVSHAADPISVGWQNGGLVLWAVVARDTSISHMLHVYVAGTGNPLDIPPEAKFIGTVQEPERPLVWHVFARAGL